MKGKIIHKVSRQELCEMKKVVGSVCVYNGRVTKNYHKWTTYVCAIDFKYCYPI